MPEFVGTALIVAFVVVIVVWLWVEQRDHRLRAESSARCCDGDADYPSLPRAEAHVVRGGRQAPELAEREQERDHCVQPRQQDSDQEVVVRVGSPEPGHSEVSDEEYRDDGRDERARVRIEIHTRI